MLWLCLPLFSIAFALRVKINRGHTWGTPDEKSYTTYAQSWKPGAAYLPFIQRFLGSEDLDIPPTRYGFYALCAGLVAALKSHPFRTVTWVAAVSGALASPVSFAITGSLPAAILVGTSALSLVLSRRAFQDTSAALTAVLVLWGVQTHNLTLLVISVVLALSTREALVLYLPAFYIAWVVETGRWVSGAASLAGGLLLALALYHVLGGRDLIKVFRKLRQSTEYVRRLQSGHPQRVLVDLVLVSPVTTLGGAIACVWAPLWLTLFILGALGVHAVITPKNVRFLLIVDLAIRMACAWLPGSWPWVVLGASLVSDAWMYKTFLPLRDTVTYNLVVASKMYSEK